MLRNFNDRIDLRPEPEVMNIIPFVNDEQRIGVKALDKQTGSEISGISITMNVPDQLEKEQLITDKNGQTYYQLQPAKSRVGSYTIIFNVDYENLVENFEEEVKKLFSKLNLNWEKQLYDFHKNERPVETASFMQVRSKIYKKSSEQWKSYKKYLTSMTDILSADNVEF